MTKQSKKKTPVNVIAQNRKARHNYSFDTTFEAGIALEGWEVKSLRAGRGQLQDSYVILKNNEAWIVNSHISPLNTASTHIEADPTRSRKLLLHRKEINKLRKAREAQGYTIVVLDLHWKRNRAKAKIALAKGKKLHDKRQTDKQRDWQKQKQRLLKSR
jgi:SsrA-binding protein